MDCTVIFVCVENAGRSQMAEAFFNRHAPRHLRASSAGTRPATMLDPTVVQVMEEVGIKLSSVPKALDADHMKQSAQIIGMGCVDEKSCPGIMGAMDDWGIPDPKGKTLLEVREIRDEIERRVMELVARLGRE